MEIWGQSGKNDIFSKSIHNFPNLFVGGSTLHRCYILPVRFDEFLQEKLAGPLKLIVLFGNFYQIDPKIRFSLPVLKKFYNF